MKKIIFILTFAVFFFTPKSFAQYQAPTPATSINIDKLIGQPIDSKGGVTYNYVDNISVNDYIFSPLNYLFFKVKVKNTSNIDLNNVVIYDYKPDYSELFSDPGIYDDSNKILTINVGGLKANEEKEYLIRGRVLSADQLPATGKISCPTNRVRVESDSASDEDNTQYCVQNKAKVTPAPVKTVPKAGPELNFVILVGTGALFYLGIKLKPTS